MMHSDSVSVETHATFTRMLHPILLEFESQRLWFIVFFFLFQFLSRRSHRRYLLTGEGLKSLCYEMRIVRNHLLPAASLHHVGHVTCIDELNRLELCRESVIKHTGLSHHYLSLELLCRMKIRQDENVADIFNCEAIAQCFFTHHLHIWP